MAGTSSTGPASSDGGVATAEPVGHGAPSGTGSPGRDGAAKRHSSLHPILIALVVLLLAAALTHLMPAGEFERAGEHVVPGTYHVVPKLNGLPAMVSPTPPDAEHAPARASGIVGIFAAIPAGFVDQAPLIFLLLFAGATFGMLRATGALDAAIDGLVHLTSGNRYLLISGVTVMLACGATFMGFISEYLAVTPLVLVLTKRLGLPNLFAAAAVILGGMVGFVASVTNPNALAVAQPLAGVPIFSGIPQRLTIFIAMLSAALVYLMLHLRKVPKIAYTPGASRITRRQAAVLATLVAGGTGLVVCTSKFSWHHAEQAAAFVALTVALAVAGRVRPPEAADAAIDGMKSMVLAVAMIGLGGAVGVVLESSLVQDSIINSLAATVAGQPPLVVITGFVITEMLFGILIHSVSAKAAISMPILAPVAHLSGVSGQLAVTSLLLGSGLINMISPTNGLLLAFLAIAKVDYVDWIKFMLPLFAMLTAIGMGALYILVQLGGA